MSKLVILVGIPGSGKSTYAAKEFPDFVYISQDANNGRRDITWNKFRNAMEEKKNVLLDRCNINKSQRNPWINYALQTDYKEIEGIYLECDPDIAVTRATSRKDHKTIGPETPLEKVHEIIYGFFKSYQAMELNEGFTRITMLRNY